MELFDEFKQIFVSYFCWSVKEEKIPNETKSSYMYHPSLSPFCCKQKRIRAVNLVALILPSP